MVHPSFNFPFNDIALLELSSAVTIDTTKQTIAIPTSNQTGFYQASGWGLTSSPGVNPDALQVTWMAPRDNSDCTNAHGFFMQNHQLCAGYPDGSRGTCFGDSGGPLFLRGNPAVLIGLTSGGSLGCDNVGHFTRVWSFRTWINNTISPALPNISMTWSGNLVPTGQIRLLCEGTGQSQSASTGTRGLRLSMVCRDSWVTASCTTNGYRRREVDGFSRTVNGTSTSLGHGTTSASDRFYVGSTDTVSWNCELTD